MPKYMLLIGGAALDDLGRGSEEWKNLMNKYGQWNQKLEASKKLLAANKLRDGQGRRVAGSRHGQQPLDGPFIETKETICGYYLLEAENYEEAVAIAKENPTVLYQGGFVEVREIDYPEADL